MTIPTVTAEIKIEEMSNATWRIAVYVEGVLYDTAEGFTSFEAASDASEDFLEMVKSIPGVAGPELH